MENNAITLEIIDDDDDDEESILNIQENAQKTQVNAKMNINLVELELEEIYDFIKLIPSDKTLIEDKNKRYKIYSHLLDLYCYVESKLKDQKFYFSKKPLINIPERIVEINEIATFRQRIKYTIDHIGFSSNLLSQIQMMMSVLHTFFSCQHKNLSTSDSVFKFFGRLIKNIPNFASDIYEANKTSMTWYQIFIVAIIIWGASFFLHFLLIWFCYKRFEFMLFHYIKITLIWIGLPCIKNLTDHIIHSDFWTQKIINILIFIFIYNIIKYIVDLYLSKNVYRVGDEYIIYDKERKDFFDFESNFQSSAFSIQT